MLCVLFFFFTTIGEKNDSTGVYAEPGVFPLSVGIAGGRPPEVVFLRSREGGGKQSAGVYLMWEHCYV